jgi:hypothetical protein
MVARVQDRVDELERRLEDRTASIRTAMEFRVANADTRAFVSSVSASIGWFVADAAIGVVVTLLFGS